jgi:hypothetical protein
MAALFFVVLLDENTNKHAFAVRHLVDPSHVLREIFPSQPPGCTIDSCPGRPDLPARARTRRPALPDGGPACRRI